MKPFSPLYFIKENKARSILLIFMIILGFGVYIGGLYITNPYDNWVTCIENYEKIVTVSANTSDGYTEDFEWFKKEAENSGKVTVLELGSSNGFSWKSIMGFDTGQCTFTFRTVEDFYKYCKYMGIECDFTALKSGSMIMSDRFAKNVGLKIGDNIDKTFDINIYDEFSLDAVTNEDGYTLYFITNEDDVVPSIMLLGNGIEGSEVYDYAYGLLDRMEDKTKVYVYPGLRGEIESQFETFNMIYMFVVVLLAVILAITINAAFIGMYQRRRFEFAVYRAIGISKTRIVGKIVGELLMMDLIALIIGAFVTMLIVYLLNNMVLYPKGQYLRYFNFMALFSLILCNVIAIAPLIVTRCRQMLKSDICEY